MRVNRRAIGIGGLAAVIVVGVIAAFTTFPQDRLARWVEPVLSSPDASQGPNAGQGLCGGWECPIAERFEPAARLVAEAPGYLGVAVRDRETGQLWTAGAVDRPIWTASTIKVAIIADQLVRARAGELTIGASDRRGFDQMLSTSYNRPATNLWAKHGGEAALERYRTVFGMTGVQFPTEERLWGAIKATTLDFVALMKFVLEDLHPDDRAYLVHGMRTVAEIQQWGVWCAGPEWEPGVKAGWNVEENPDGERHWVVNSVGFAGPDERYIVSVMYELLPGTQVPGHRLGDGEQVVSDVVATLFGAPVPASVPDPALLIQGT